MNNLNIALLIDYEMYEMYSSESNQLIIENMFKVHVLSPSRGFPYSSIYGTKNTANVNVRLPLTTLLYEII